MIPFDTVIFIGTVAAVLTFIDCFFAYIARFTFRVPYMVLDPEQVENEMELFF